MLVIGLLLAASFTRSGSDGRGDLSVLMEPDGTGVWRDLIERYNRTGPDVPVRLVEGPPSTNTREDMYSTAFLAGQAGFDLVFCDVIWVPKFAAAGWLLDLTDRISSEDRADFLAADLEGGMYEGRLYRIPALTDAGLLYFRSDLAPRPPETFEDLERMASRLSTADRWGYLWQGRQYEGLITNYLEVLWGHGGEWITRDREVRLDSPQALDALLFLKSTIGRLSPPGVTTYAEEEGRLLFQNGRSVFLRNWLYVSMLIDLADSPVRGRVDFVPMVHAPGEEGAAALGGWGFAISRFTPNPDAAWDFVQFITRPEQLEEIQSRKGAVPARRSLVPEAFQSILETARPRPMIPEYAQASDILQRWLSRALVGAADPEEALARAARETRALLRSPNGP